ncbi:MAG TPA: DUF1993 domain-containing protein [Steroidobacteraceae bacterium]|nr:DUF1993 domain-containing protein [Steroidobacteraceae bacterium]
MSNPTTQSIQSMFASRLETLAHLLKRAEEHFGGNASFLERRLAPDMAPFGTQIAYACNQPRNFALWSQGKPSANLDPNVVTLEQAHAHTRSTKELVAVAVTDDSQLAAKTRIDLGHNLYAEMSGTEFVSEFLIPNFYFHLVTAYGILRMAGMDVGKRDYMLHMMPYVRQA